MQDPQSIPVTTTTSPPRTILVLGGGGLKGIAHIGVWKALHEARVIPDAIMGTSIGALIGAAIAAGVGWADMAQMARDLTRDDLVKLNRRAVFFGGVRQNAVFLGTRYQQYIRRVLPAKRFSDLRIPFRLNTVSLVTGREIWYGSGARLDLPLHEAVYASCALPIFFPPLRTPDDYLVDGGVLDVFPIGKAAEWGATRIIGVDVGQDFLPPNPGALDQGMIAIHDRVLNINLREQRAARLTNWNGPDLLYIRPQVGHLSGWEFDRNTFLLEEGYRAAREALAHPPRPLRPI